MSTRFAKVGDAHVAYRVIGEGPTDLLYFLGEYLPVDAIEEEPRYGRALRRLGALGRLITFNRRGVGLSDAPDGPLTLEQNVEDALAVLDHAGSSQAAIVAANIAVPSAIRLAARRPERVAALVLVNGSARLLAAPGYDIGIPETVITSFSEQATAIEPTEEFDFLTSFAPSVARDDRFRAWWDSAGHRGASPARARELWRLGATIDVRDDLGSVTAPTLVVHYASLATVSHGRYLAEHISGARYVELPGHDLVWWVGDTNAVLDEIETFLSMVTGSARRARRALASVMLVDVVGSTDRAAALGDRRWRELLDTYHELVRREIGRHGGRQVGTEGDGVLATFEMPADAVRCAAAIAQDVRSIDLDVRAGVHTGEIEILADDVAGIGVHIAARVKEAAGPGEVLVSRTVVDLVTGSGFRFEDRGEHELKGVPGRWALFALNP